MFMIAMFIFFLKKLKISMDHVQGPTIEIEIYLLL